MHCNERPRVAHLRPDVVKHINIVLNKKIKVSLLKKGHLQRNLTVKSFCIFRNCLQLSCPHLFLTEMPSE